MTNRSRRRAHYRRTGEEGQISRPPVTPLPPTPKREPTPQRLMLPTLLMVLTIVVLLVYAMFAAFMVGNGPNPGLL